MLQSSHIAGGSVSTTRQLSVVETQQPGRSKNFAIPEIYACHYVLIYLPTAITYFFFGNPQVTEVFQLQ
ncbi:hypothetical protein [Nostoc sp.]|uniref:hypothetical protein n=1 Tax=Nostoc sp. TaxID=1180 RepID=UPI002FF9E879